MSEIAEADGARRPRRADARRSIAAIVEAAIAVLGERPAASMDEIARAAGVTRQTIYAHFASRDALLAAIVQRATEEAIAAIDGARIDQGPPAQALVRLLDLSWRTMERYPVLSSAATAPLEPGHTEHDRHGPIIDRLTRLIARGQRSGDFDGSLSPTWLTAAAIGLGHAAGEEVAAGRMTARQATQALTESVLRVFGAKDG